MFARLHRFTAIILPCLTTALPIVAMAQNLPPAITELRGITLGTELFSAFKECPKRPDPIFKKQEYLQNFRSDYPPEFKDVPCFKETSKSPVLANTKIYEIDNLTFINGAGRAAEVHLINDRIEYIEVVFSNSYRNQFYSALKDKYGRPSKESTSSYRNAMGQTFTGRSLVWASKSSELLYDEYQTGSPEWGYMRLISRIFQAQIDAWHRESRENIRRGL